MAPPADLSLTTSLQAARPGHNTAVFGRTRPHINPVSVAAAAAARPPHRHTTTTDTTTTTTRAQVSASPESTRVSPVTATDTPTETGSDIFSYRPRSGFNRLSLKANRKRKAAAAAASSASSANTNEILPSAEHQPGPLKSVKRARLDSSADLKTELKTGFNSELKTKLKTGKGDNTMMNGHNLHGHSANGVSHSKESSRFSLLDSMSKNTTSMGGIQPPVASLANLGNTCFLNSVLYTLRFTPGFLHSLHHLVCDLGLQTATPGPGSGATSNGKKKNHSGNGGNGSGNGNGSIADAETELVHDVVDQLHDLFKNMSCTDDSVSDHGTTLGGSNSSGSREPIPPNSFLQAVGKLNPMFEGNQQQDAHELLVTVLNTLQDIKIPAPSPAPNWASDGHANGVDAVDSAEPPPVVAASQKKSSKKKSGKSIFYGGSQNNSLLVNVSNGLR